MGAKTQIIIYIMVEEGTTQQRDSVAQLKGPEARIHGRGAADNSVSVAWPYL